MKTRTIITPVAALLLLSACGTKQDSTQTAWLIGTWENETPSGRVCETWSRAGDNGLSASSYFVNQNDTVVLETIRLVQEEGRWFYIPTVNQQNNNQPVRFAARTISEDQLVFENPEHDFPQTISYTRIGADSLLAEISGTADGKERREAFPMKRVK